MTEKIVVRRYTVKLPNDRHEFDALMEEMIEQDPEIMTGNYGDPDKAWLEECLAVWITCQYGRGKHEDIVDVEVYTEEETEE